MRRLSILVNLLLFVGCAGNIVAPPEPRSVVDLGDYFWQSQDTSYTYRDGVDSHVVSIIVNGNQYSILDRNSLGRTTTLLASVIGKGVSIKGLSDETFLRLPLGSMLVQSLTPQLPPELRVSAIADMHSSPGFHGVVVATDRGLYTYASKGDSLTDLHTELPSTQISQLYEANNGFWYAISMPESKAYYSTNGGDTWIQLSLPSGTITATGLNEDDLYVAIGSLGVYKVLRSASTLLIATPKQQVNSIAATASDDLLFGMESGLLSHYDGNSIDYSDTITASGGAQAVRTVYLAKDGVPYVATASKLFRFNLTSWREIALDGSQVNDIWDDMGDVYFATSAGSIYRDHNGTVQSISRVASGLRSVLPSSGRKFAVAGDSLYVSQNNYVQWTKVKQPPAAPPQWTEGSFQLLPNSTDTSWTAGNLLLQSQPPFGVKTYIGHNLGSTSDIVLNGKTYKDVVLVRYAIESGGAIDTVSAPQYVVFYQSKVGPIRIESTQQNHPPSVLQRQ